MFDWSRTASFPGCAGKMTGECWWLRDATEPAHSLSASQNLKLLLICIYLLSSRFIVVVGLGNKIVPHFYFSLLRFAKHTPYKKDGNIFVDPSPYTINLLIAYDPYPCRFPLPFFFLSLTPHEFVLSHTLCLRNPLEGDATNRDLVFLGMSTECGTLADL